MTAEDQRIKIAETCGIPIPKGVLSRNECLPDYLNDLNAIHEAIMAKIFNQNLHSAWFRSLYLVTHGKTAFETNNATAAERSEAFLRAIGKWE